MEEISHMENILSNPGLRHILDTIVKYLDNRSVETCQKVSTSFKYIIEEKKLHYVHQIQKIKSARGRRTIEGVKRIVKFTSIHDFEHHIDLLDAFEVRKSLGDLEIVANYITAYLAKQDFKYSPFCHAFKDGHIDFIKLFINKPREDLFEMYVQGYLVSYNLTTGDGALSDSPESAAVLHLLVQIKKQQILDGFNIPDEPPNPNGQAEPMPQWKEWHRTLTIYERNYLIERLAMSILSSPNARDLQNESLLGWAKKVERKMYELADSESEYYRNIAERIVGFQIDLARKRWKRDRQRK